MKGKDGVGPGEGRKKGREREWKGRAMTGHEGTGREGKEKEEKGRERRDGCEG
jgi:hypothetical protein